MPDNLILARLSPDLRGALAPDLSEVTLPQGTSVIEPGMPINYVIFPKSCVVSFVTELESGGAVEAAMVGHEGVVGLEGLFGPGVSNVRGIVQVGGKALSMPIAAFRRHFEDPRLSSELGAFSQYLFSLASQSAACQAFHTVEQRLARWLLMVQDRVESADLPLTQEFLAAMLGVQRPTVTVTARLLQAAKLIHYRHGHIQVLDREGLEGTACECYAAMRSRLRISSRFD